MPPTAPLPEVTTSTLHAPHWERPVNKRIYLLNVTPDGNSAGYQPRISSLTFPLIANYARKIGAAIVTINTRKFPEFPITYEKLQIHELAKRAVPAVIVHPGEPPFGFHLEDVVVPPAEWNIYIDLDAMVSPEFFDVTQMIPKDHVCHNGRDMANMRWRYDQYFKRDGRHWGSCNWFTVGSDWMLDAWRPLDDITPTEALGNISITIQEHNSGHCKTEHLIDDYTLSRNIARFGLKATTLVDVCGNLGFRDPGGKGFNPFLWHIYTEPEEMKLSRMLDVLASPNRAIIPDPRNPQQPRDVGWGLMDPAVANKMREEWKLPRK